MSRIITILCSLVALPMLAGAASAGPLRVVTTTPDLADLARQVGGDEVDVTTLTRGPQDPHFVEPRPSFVTKLHRADAFVQIGMQLEVGWVPVLLRQARNPKIQPGGEGWIDASVAISALEVPTAPTSRAAGDVHPYGNPHYLTDPVNGLRVARLLADRFGELRPAARQSFEAGYADFARRLLAALVGEAAVEEHGVARLEPLAFRGTLAEFLADAGSAPGGWLGALAPMQGARAVQDHRIWPYFARRFGIEIVGELEPLPGIAPTTRHLEEVVARMREQDVGLVLATAYFDARHARFVAGEAGARVVEMAHQPGARPDTPDFLSTVDYNVRQMRGTP